MRKLIVLCLALLACGNPVSSKVEPAAHTGDVDVIPGQIAVDFQDDVSDEDILQIGNSLGVHFHAGNPTTKSYKLEDAVVDPAKEQAVLDALNANPKVEVAEPAIEAHIMWTPNDPMYNEQWGITRIGSESAWNMTCGMGVRVAVVDTGVDAKLSDFAGTKFEEGYNFVSNSQDATDDQGHGSHVAGTIAETTNNSEGGAGVAHCTTIIPVKVLAATGGGTMEGVAAGIRYAADRGANVINLSLGAHVPSRIVEKAVNYALDHGVVVVAANGNSGGSIGYPAGYPGVIAVSAIDSHDNIASFSSRGPQTVIAAPGVDVLQQTIDGAGGGKYAKFSGTSMATPMTAAAAALVVSTGITKPEAVKAKLQATADPKDDPEEYGAGIVRADKAVRSALFNQLLVRLLALGAVLFYLRKKIDMALVQSKAALAGITVGGFGLFPLFFTGVLPRLGSYRVFGELFARPFGMWDMIIGYGHSYLLLASCLPVVGLSLLTMHTKKVRILVGGFVLGAMALEGQLFWSNDAGGLMTRIWLGVSMLVCGYFVKNLLAKK